MKSQNTNAMKVINFAVTFLLLTCLFACQSKNVNQESTVVQDTIVDTPIDTIPYVKRIGIKMTKTGGVYEIPCLVNGVKMNFIFDTGASNVCISLTEALFLYKNGYITEDDLGERTRSVVADGSITTNTRLTLKTIEIAGIVLRDVDALVSSSIEAPLLLGQSAIQKLGKIEMNGDSLFITGIVETPHYAEINHEDNITQLIPASHPQVTWWDKFIAFLGEDKKVDDFINKAWIAYNNDFPELAMEYCDQAVNCNKRSWKAYAIRGHFKFWEDDYDGALADYEKVLKYDKSHSNHILETGDSITYKRCVERLATCYCAVEKYEQAIRFCQEQMAFYPSSIDLMNAMSFAYTMLENYTAAEKWANKLIVFSPAKGYFRLAYIAQSQGRKSESAKYYERVLLEDPSNAGALNNLADIYIEQGYKARAIVLKKQAASLGNRTSQNWLKANGYEW